MIDDIKLATRPHARHSASAAQAPIHSTRSASYLADETSISHCRSHSSPTCGERLSRRRIDPFEAHDSNNGAWTCLCAIRHSTSSQRRGRISLTIHVDQPRHRRNPSSNSFCNNERQHSEQPNRSAKNNSIVLTEGPSRAAARAYFRGVGFTKEDLHKPIIGIANTWTEIGPCNFHLRDRSPKPSSRASAKPAAPPWSSTPSPSPTASPWAPKA